MPDAIPALTVFEALAQAKALGVERLDAQLLLGRLLERSRSWLLAHDDTHLSPAQGQRWDAWLTRRAAGEPLAYLLEEKEFHGLSLKVGPDVLIPRADTETLVDWALALLSARAPEAAGARPTVLDLGTGSGAIALAIRHRHPEAQVTAVDASAGALAMARHNAAQLGLDIELRQGDWWDGLQGRRFDLVLSNPPYIAGDDVHLAALRFEPRQALTPEGDGLASLRRIVAGAPAQLTPGAWLLLEHGHDQTEAVAELLRQQGFESIDTRRDLGGHVRCTGGRRPFSGAD